MHSTIVRIRFLLPRDRRLNADGKSAPVSHATLPTDFELVAADGDVITEAGNLVVRSAPLPSIDEAAQVGDRAQKAILIAAAILRLGVDLGKDAPKSRLFQGGLDMVRQLQDLPEETVILNDDAGLTLVDASRKTVFAGVGQPHVTIGLPIGHFADAFAKGYSLAPALSERSILALELFSASRFEASLRARFLTLVSAVECIAERPMRADDAMELVKSFQKQLRDAKLNDTDHAQLVGGLKDLQKRSIGGSCKTLVAEHCGADKANLFGACYKARSQLVHRGRTDFDLRTNTVLLEELVSKTIVMSIPHAA